MPVLRLFIELIRFPVIWEAFKEGTNGETRQLGCSQWSRGESPGCIT